MYLVIVNAVSEEATRRLGFTMGTLLDPGDILTLRGGLGAGKTFLTGALARGLGVDPQIPITSPSFTLINEYKGRLHIYHLDLYRLGDPDELENLPWKEALYGSGVAVIEWPERLGPFLPDERLDINIEMTGEESRLFTIKAYGLRNEQRLRSWEPKIRA